MELQRVACLFAPAAVARMTTLRGAVSRASGLMGTAVHPRVLVAAAGVIARTAQIAAPQTGSGPPRGVAPASSEQLGSSRGPVWTAIGPEAPAAVRALARCPACPFPLVTDASARGLWGLVRASMAATAAGGRTPTDDTCARALAEAFAAADYPTVTPDLSSAHRQAVARALLGLAVSAGDNEEEFVLLAATMFGVARGKTGLEELASLLRAP